MIESFEGLYEVRSMEETDRNFLLATFLRGLYYGDSWFSLVPKDIFMSNYKPIAEALVNPERTEIKIACLKEDRSVILGYSILSKDYQTVHWCFVKSAWRKRGIAKSLLPKHPTQVANLTALGKSLLHKFKSTPIFNPFAL